MAHEISEVDELALAVRPAWHGLGKVLPRRMSPMEALEAAGLDWDVRTLEMRPFTRSDDRLVDVVDQTGAPVTCGHHRAIVRRDTLETLGTVTNGWSPIQNRAIARFLQNLTDTGIFGTAHPIETAGSIRRGRRVWFLLVCGARALEVFGGADVRLDTVLASVGHDGTAALDFRPTGVRVVCANTYGEAERGAVTLKFRHEGDPEALLQRAAEAIRACKARNLATWAAEVELAKHTGRVPSPWGLTLPGAADRTAADVGGVHPLTVALHELLEGERPDDPVRGVRWDLSLVLLANRIAAGAAASRLPAGSMTTPWAWLQGATYVASHPGRKGVDAANYAFFGNGARLSGAAFRVALDAVPAAREQYAMAANGGGQ